MRLTDWRLRQSALALLFPAVLAGMLVSAQWRTQEGRTTYGSRYTVQLVEVAAELQTEQDRLKAELATIRAELDDLHARGAALTEEGRALQTQVEGLKMFAALTPVEGPGVVVTLDDARLPPTAPNLAQAIIHSQDIADVINAGWKAGAEAIEVNGERITATSACVGAVIQINGTLMSPPFVVSMIGPADRLYDALSAPTELAELKARSELYGLGFRVARSREIKIAAFTGPFNVRYAQSLE
jgi:uncharacterized protein YlxW (UPF0749 family)